MKTIKPLSNVPVVGKDKDGNLVIGTANVPAGSYITSGAGKPESIIKPDNKKEKADNAD